MNQGTIKSYILGFAISLVLTLTAYFSVVSQLFVGQMLVAVIMGFALTQFAVQLFFFLHIGPRPARHASGEAMADGWNLVTLLSTIGIVLILVVGSLWIMSHLNYNMTPNAMDVDAYLMDKEGIRK